MDDKFFILLFIDLTTIAISNTSLGGLELPPEVIMSIIVCVIEINLIINLIKGKKISVKSVH